MHTMLLSPSSRFIIFIFSILTYTPLHLSCTPITHHHHLRIFPLNSHPPSHSKFPFSSTSGPNQSPSTYPPSPSPANDFTSVISALVLPQQKPNSQKPIILAVVSVVSSIAVVAVLAVLYWRKRRFSHGFDVEDQKDYYYSNNNNNKTGQKQTVTLSSSTSKYVYQAGTIVNSRSGAIGDDGGTSGGNGGDSNGLNSRVNCESPELIRPLPPPVLSQQPTFKENPAVADMAPDKEEEEEEEEEFTVFTIEFSDRGRSLSSSCRSSFSFSVDPKSSVGVVLPSPSPTVSIASTTTTPVEQEEYITYVINNKAVGSNFTASSTSAVDSVDDEASKPKLKCEKVRATSGHEMVWDHFRSFSFQ